MNGSREVALCDVSNFVCQYASEFVFTARCFEKPRMHANIAAWQSERVDSMIFYNKEREVTVTVVGLGSDFIADNIDVLINERIFYNLAAVTNIAHDCAPNARFFVGRKYGIRRATHIGELDVICSGTTGKHDCRHNDG